MNLSFTLRLICLCAASFFLVNLALGLTISMLAPLVVRLGERMNPRWAGELLLGARVTPAAIGLIVVALLPGSYARMEPNFSVEHVGAVCLLAALLGVAVWTIALTRAVRAITRARRYIRHCEKVGSRACLSPEMTPVLVIEEPLALFTLAGILRPQLVVSRSAMLALSEDQLTAALRHEEAHRTAYDNLKRLLLLLAPDVLPFVRAFGSLERGWNRFAEWAADDGAAAGSTRHSLSLAEALVRIARMGACPELPPLCLPLLVQTQELSDRVDRLLSLQRRAHPSPRLTLLLAAATFTASALWLAALTAQPGTLQSLHLLLELLHDSL